MLAFVRCIEAMDFVRDWESWRKYLKDAIAAGRMFGMTDEALKEMTLKMSEFLRERLCPGTKENELFREMWDTSTPEERKVLANILFRLVK